MCWCLRNLPSEIRSHRDFPSPVAICPTNIPCASSGTDPLLAATQRVGRPIRRESIFDFAPMPLKFEGRGRGVLCHCLDRQDAPVGVGDEFGRHGESIAVPPGVSAPPVSKIQPCALSARRRPSSAQGAGRVNRVRNSSSARRSPSSVRTTDFALFAGFAINPFWCKRSRAFESNPFQARLSMQRQPKQAHNGIVDLVGVDLHASSLTRESAAATIHTVGLFLAQRFTWASHARQRHLGGRAGMGSEFIMVAKRPWQPLLLAMKCGLAKSSSSLWLRCRRAADRPAYAS